MVRLDWIFIAKLVVGFVIALCVGVTIWSIRTPSHAPILADPEFNDRTLDFADAATRRAILDHEIEIRGWTLASIANECDRGDEIYRAQSEPGLSGGDFRIVEIRVSSSNAKVTEFTFGNVSTPAGDARYGWRTTFEAVIEAERLAQARAALTAALKDDVAPAVDDRIVDSPDLVVETCRRSRYHFFERHILGAKEASEVVSLARSVLRLADRRHDKTR